MNNSDLAQRILDDVGGVRNITSVTHCVTRLRFILKDVGRADTAAIEALDGVLSVQHQGGQYQVIVGTRVNALYREVVALAPGLEANASSLKADEPGETGHKKSVVTKVLETLSAILIPSLPPIIGGGMLKGFLYMFWGFGWIAMESPMFMLLDIMSDCMFYFYPFLLAVSAAERFHTNKYMALALAGALMSKTILGGVGGDAEAFSIGIISIPYLDYSASVIPIILNVWLMSYVYRFLEKRIPEIVSVIFTPMLTLVVMVPVALAAVAPLGYAVGEWLAVGIQALIDFSPVVAGFVIGALRPLTVFTGTHHAVRAIVAQQLATYGYTTIGAMNYMSTMAQAAAPLAVYLVLRNSNTKMANISLSSAVSGFLGVTEPGLYGVIMKYKVAIIATCIGGGVGAAIAATFGAAEYGMVMSSIVTIPATMGDGFMGVVIGLPVSIVMTMAIILAMRGQLLKEDGATSAGEAVYELAGSTAGGSSAVRTGAGAGESLAGSAAATVAVSEEMSDESLDSRERILAVASPCAGAMKPLETLGDAVAGKAGVALCGVSGDICSPVAGAVTRVSEHAVTIDGDGAPCVTIQLIEDGAALELRESLTGTRVAAGECIATVSGPTVLALCIEDADAYLDVFPSTNRTNVVVGDTAVQVIVG